MASLNLPFQTAEWEIVVRSKRAMAALRFFDFGTTNGRTDAVVQSERKRGEEERDSSLEIRHVKQDCMLNPLPTYYSYGVSNL